ncbi:adenosine deaminase [Dactylosporangium matsuzakiense]|uniref:Adenosine/adenine deaminase n=1 Tax=Dactylosporangium matsuzakiense TaxID=53360 RepID=A0A9W6NIT9_9ACTN|nr:adenosine deaminase [Dactylosporangium matsuzakiense]GLK99184.1 putative adenosine/adenine deaminase [Dactylosporangium matsuzakiense]
MTGTIPARDLTGLPKAHLHVHLEGAMRPQTLADLADRYGVVVPQARGFGSFAVFLDLYLAACDLLRDIADLDRLTREVVQDAARDGAVWVEPSIYPMHHVRLAPVEEIVGVVVDAGLSAARECGIGFGLMVGANRTQSPAEAADLARVAARAAGRGVVSFGLADDETSTPPEPFAPAFALARDAGLLSAPHGGELAGPDSVRGALDALAARRVQHGVRAAEDADLVRRLADEAVVLDVCPTSNVLLSVVPSLERHPLPALLDAGVRCSVNADDPLLFGCSLLSEYQLCRDSLGLSDERLAAVARASIEGSGASQPQRRDALAAIDAWLAAPPHEPAAAPSRPASATSSSPRQP